MELNLRLIKSLLEELSSVGIVEVILDPVEDGTLVRGSNREKSVAVFHVIEDSILSAPMCIQSVDGLLSRISLFDENTSKLEVKYNNAETYVLEVNVKQGRKRASYRCASDKSLSVPSRIPGVLSLGDQPICLSADYVDYLSKAFTSMAYTGSKAERFISMSIANGFFKLSVFDGEHDSFTDEQPTEAEDHEKAQWGVAAFQRVMRQSVKSDPVEQTAIFNISEHGIAIFRIGIINALVVPLQ